MSSLQHVRSSSPTRDWIQAPYFGSMESQPLEHQGSPWPLLFVSSAAHLIPITVISCLNECICLLAPGFYSAPTPSRVYTPRSTPQWWSFKNLLDDIFLFPSLSTNIFLAMVIGKIQSYLALSALFISSTTLSLSPMTQPVCLYWSF